MKDEVLIKCELSQNCNVNFCGHTQPHKRTPQCDNEDDTCGVHESVNYSKKCVCKNILMKTE